MGDDREERAILHLDMDAFYASVEALDDPSLKGKPVIVGGSGSRGVVSAASYEARRFGVHSAMAIVVARRLCPRGVFLPVRMARYRQVSDEVFGIFRRYTPLVEPLSIDEAFLDVTGCRRLFGPPGEIARRIRADVRSETGLTVSAGVATSKLVAKIASDLHKPDGLTVVPPGTERSFLSPLPVGRLWGVGKVTQEELARLGVRTIGELAGVPAEILRRRFGVQGERLRALAGGIDPRDVETEEDTKSVGHEDTYEEDVTDRGRMSTELLDLSHRVAARLRRCGFRGRTVTLKVKYADFVQVTRAETLSRPTDDGGEIYRTVLSLLGKTEAGRRPVRLLGVSLSRLDDGAAPRQAAVQMALFDPRPPGRTVAAAPPPPSPERIEKLNRAVDRIRQRFGDRGILPGSLIEK